jgi:hypothetical protein
MRLDLLPHEARLAVLWGQVGVADAAMLLIMSGDAWCRGGDLSAQCGLYWSSSSRHSMSATYGPRDIISLVTPRLGGNNPKAKFDNHNN